MYRQYEDPYTLEERLEQVKQQLAQCDPDSNEYEWLCIEKAELEDRINFAWQDNEYEEDYAREYYPEYYAEECM